MKRLSMICCFAICAALWGGESSDPEYGSDIGSLVHNIPLSGPNRATKYYLAYQDSIRVLKTKKKANILSPNIVFAYKNLLVALHGIHWDKRAAAKVEEFYDKFHENLYLLAAVSIDDRPLFGVMDPDHILHRGDTPNITWMFSTAEHDRARILGLLLAPGMEEKFKAASPALQAYYYRNIIKHLAVLYVPNWKTDTVVPPPIRKVVSGEKPVRRHSAAGKDIPPDSVRLEAAWTALCKLSEANKKDEPVQTAWREAQVFYEAAKQIPARPLPAPFAPETDKADVVNPDSSRNCGYNPWLPNALRTAEKLAEQRKQGLPPEVPGYQYLRSYLDEKKDAIKQGKAAWDEDDAQIQRILRAAYPEQTDRIGRAIKQMNPAKKPPFTVTQSDDVCRVHISADRFYRRIVLPVPAEIIPPEEGYDVMKNGLLYHFEKDEKEVRLIFCYLPAGEYDLVFSAKKD